MVRDRRLSMGDSKQLNGKSELNSIDVANYFVNKIDDTAGDLISNLKLQKLVYYAQGFSLAIFGKPLFDDVIEAWLYGPVVPNLYQKYKKYKYEALPIPKDVDFDKYDEQTRELLDEVYTVYGQYSAWVLSDFTHKESPYINARKRADKGNGDVITHGELKSYFLTQIQN